MDFLKKVYLCTIIRKHSRLRFKMMHICFYLCYILNNTYFNPFGGLSMEDRYSFTSNSLRSNSQDQVGGYFQSNKYCCSLGGYRKERGSCSLDLRAVMREKERTA